MTQSGPLLSVLIPTKDRARYAISTIRGILEWRNGDFEVVVQDNSTNDELADAVRPIRDSRLRYYRTPEPLDMEGNFSAATLNSRGEYLAFIGDDDGMIEESIDVARWAREQNIQAVFPSGMATFLWPDVRTPIYGSHLSGVLRISRFAGRASSRIGESEIRKCLRSAGQDLHSLPRAYFGLVRRDLMDAVRLTSGSFFPGPSPDLANAIALACVAESISEIEYPIFIHGTGARSVGGLGAVKRHVGRLEDWPHLPQWSVARWSAMVPQLFLGQTVWAEDVVQSLTAMARVDLLRDFNSARLHAVCLCSHPAYWRPILRSGIRHLRVMEGSRASWVARFGAGYVYAWWQRLHSLTRNIVALASFGSETLVRNVEDSEAAMNALAEFLRRNKLSFRECIKESHARFGPARSVTY